MLKVHINKKNFGRGNILEEFHYDFKDKGLFVINGKSGVGKTTLLRIISGLDTDFDGYVIGGGFSKVSCHFQEYRLFDNLSVFDNIFKVSFKTSTQDNMLKTKEILKRLGFTEDEFKLFPPQLSGGMKQRVSFARAILKDSGILLLDEPTKELDPLLSKEICKIIEEESEFRLVIMVTHVDHTADFSSPTLINL